MRYSTDSEPTPSKRLPAARTRSYTNFALQLRRVERLYYGTIDAYARVADTLRAPLTSDSRELSRESLSRNQLLKSLPDQLRQSLIIQLVSVLEVYFVETLRELFLLRRDLFHEQSTIEFKQQEVLAAQSIHALWTKVINRKLRQLQNQGFTEVRKFFRKQLDIDFAASGVQIRYLELLHDTRHLIVHRLGKVDSEFAHRYNHDKSDVRIEHTDLVQAVQSLWQLSGYVNEKVMALVAKPTVNRTDSDANQIEFTIQLLDGPADRSVLDPKFSFWVNEELYHLGDLLRARVDGPDDSVILTLGGPQKVLHKYWGELKKRRGTANISLIGQRRRNWEVGGVTTSQINTILAELDANGAKEAKSLAATMNISKSKMNQIVLWRKQNLGDRSVKLTGQLPEVPSEVEQTAQS